MRASRHALPDWVIVALEYLEKLPFRERTIAMYSNALVNYACSGEISHCTPYALRAVSSVLPRSVLNDFPRVEKEHREYERKARVRALRRDIDRPVCPDELIVRAQRYAPDLLPAVMLILYTGMRRGDVVRLRWRDVQFDRHRIVLEDPKGGRPYIVPMIDVLENYLRQEFLRRTPNPDDPVVPTNPKTLTTRFTRYLKVSPHRIRHYFATQLLKNGVPIAVVARLLNHKNVQTTYHYMSADQSDLLDALRKGLQ